MPGVIPEDAARRIVRMLSQYLTIFALARRQRGPHFRHRVEAIMEKFTDLQVDRERKPMMRLGPRARERINLEGENRHRQLASQRLWHGRIEDLTELAVIPNGPVTPAREAVPQFVADIAAWRRRMGVGWSR